MVSKLNLPGQPTFKGPAMLWKRILAFVIDLFIIDFVIGFPFRSIIMRIIPTGSFSENYTYLSTHSNLTTALSLIMFLFGMLAMLYFAILEYKLGQTIGKIFMNIKVESDRDNLSFFACLIRGMFLLFIFPFILLWIIDPLFLMFNKDGRRLSEILSKTRSVAVYNL